jgi:hypothetical protein
VVTVSAERVTLHWARENRADGSSSKESSDRFVGSSYHFTGRGVKQMPVRRMWTAIRTVQSTVNRYVRVSEARLDGNKACPFQTR